MISIIIPTFNRKELLHEALSRLFAGNYKNFECVIVDDASTDGTFLAVDDWQREYGIDRITYLRQKSNQGAQIARNRGIEESKGNYLLFMDSDDVLCPEGILALHSHLQANPLLDYCYGRVLKTDLNLKPIKPIQSVGHSFTESPVHLGGYHWHTIAALFSRRCIERVGSWNPGLTGSQDWEYQGRVKLYGGRGEFVDTIVGFWRQHDGLRVGTSLFRPDYVKSVMLASDSILSHARHAGRCDQALEVRIAKRLFIHALEWGANGYASEREACLRQALASISSPGYFRLLLILFAWMPPLQDGILWRLLLKKL
jgi:glycosyltransferase involved in cell wall biosynthesis